MKRTSSRSSARITPVPSSVKSPASAPTWSPRRLA
nr:MAG TPA: hypothetical protein [Caudoviricetes sp.]